MTRRRTHPSAGALEALIDGEGPISARLRTRIHCWRCPSCAARAAVARHDVARVASLLATPATPAAEWPDTADAWERVLVRSGRRDAGLANRRRPVVVAATVLAAAVALVVAVSIDRWSTGDLVTTMYRLSASDRDAPKRPTRRDVDFGRSVAALEASGQARQLSDVCCADRDGEGPADDGVLTLRITGSRSPVVILYEDNAHRGRFLPGDVVLNVSRPGVSALAGRLRASAPDETGDVRE